MNLKGNHVDTWGWGVQTIVEGEGGGVEISNVSTWIVDGP